MSILDTAEYRRLALIAAGVDPCDIPCILDTAAWRRLMLKALYDLSQGGGGSPGYINGSVQFYTDLPVTVGTPAVNTAYLVRENSGVWFINRKPAGIYVRLFNNGNLNDWDYAGTFPEVNDAQYFRIYDSADPTREVAFNVSGVAAATTRTLTVPNANGTIALTSDIPPAFNPASPGPIGNVTPAAGTFTNLVANTELQLPSAAPASPSAGDLYRVTDTIRYRDSGNVERLLLNSTDNLANLASAATARTNLGLGSAAVSASTDFAAASHNHAASAITSGVLDNARINFASPSAIGSTTAAAITGTTGTFSTLSANNGTITASAPVLDLSQTWNNSAVTFTGLRFNVTNTNSSALSLLVDLQVGGTTQFSVRRDGLVTCGNRISILSAQNGLEVSHATNGASPVRYTADTSGTGNAQIRSSGNVIEQIGTTATSGQTFRLYNTFTDSSNYERGFMRWSSNVLQIGTEAGGTGSARNLELQRGGATRITLNATGTEVRGTSFPPLDCVRGDGTGNLNDVISSFAISASYSNYANGSGPAMAFRNGSTVLARLGPRQTAAGADFVIETGSGNTERLRIIDDRITFGGTTSSFPALKRSSTTLQVRLADDSAYSVLDAQLRAQGTAPATTGATGTAGDIRYDADYIYICTAANTWKRAAIATW